MLSKRKFLIKMFWDVCLVDVVPEVSCEETEIHLHEKIIKEQHQYIVKLFSQSIDLINYWKVDISSILHLRLQCEVPSCQRRRWDFQSCAQDPPKSQTLVRRLGILLLPWSRPSRWGTRLSLPQALLVFPKCDTWCQGFGVMAKFEGMFLYLANW